jgi:hypothetical protein
MNLIKMEILNARTRPLNRWDKDSIRPGPVGSVGDVNLQVKLKKSAPYLPNRYLKAFSGKNEVWSGSNISDGQWTGFTSGGRGALTISKTLGYRSGFKTPVGWVFENVVAADRSEMAKMVPLGQYGWEQEKAKIYKAKTTGEQFLPLPMGYTKAALPRGSQFPIIAAESSGTGTALPAAEVEITNPEFGKTGSVDIPASGCPPEETKKIWAPARDDPIRNDAEKMAEIFTHYPWRSRYARDLPPAPGDTSAWNTTRQETVTKLQFSACGGEDRPTLAGAIPVYVPAGKRAKEGDYRREEQKREEEKRKQRMK